MKYLLLSLLFLVGCKLEGSNTTYYATTVFGPVVCKKSEASPCGLKLSDCGGVDGTPFPNLVIYCATNVGSEK